MFTLDKASTVRKSAPEMVAMHWRKFASYASTFEELVSTLIDASIPESLFVQLKMLVLAGEEYEDNALGRFVATAAFKRRLLLFRKIKVQVLYQVSVFKGLRASFWWCLQ